MILDHEWARDRSREEAEGYDPAIQEELAERELDEALALIRVRGARRIRMELHAAAGGQRAGHAATAWEIAHMIVKATLAEVSE